MDDIATKIPCRRCKVVTEHRHSGDEPIDHTCKNCGSRRGHPFVPTMSDMGLSMERGRLESSGVPPRGRSYQVADRSVQGQRPKRRRSRSPTERKTNYRQRDQNSWSKSSPHSLVRSADASRTERSQGLAKKSDPPSQYVKSSGSPAQTKVVVPKNRDAQKPAKPPREPCAMRDAQETSLAGDTFAMVHEHRKPQIHPASYLCVYKQQFQDTVAQPEYIKVEDRVDVDAIGEFALLPKEDYKSLGALGYPTLIGQEDWCLKCHTNDHRALDCPGAEPYKDTAEDQRYKLLLKICPSYMLSTSFEVPQNDRILVKEVVIHALDIRRYKHHVRQRDQLFSELFDEMSDREMAPFQEIWFRFMSSINHSMCVCTGGLARRPFRILKDAVKNRYMYPDESLNKYVTRLFESDSDNTPVQLEIIDTVKDSLDVVRLNYEAWLKKWNVELQDYLGSCPRIRKLDSANRDWLLKAFSTLRTAQPQFEYRNSRWIQHLSYPDIDIISSEFA